MNKMLFTFGIVEVSFLVYKSFKVALSRSPLVNVRHINSKT